MPKVVNPRVDLLGETADGGLVHLELQSGNAAAMPLHMAEYCLRVFRLFGRFSRQVLLFVGEPPPSELDEPSVRILDAQSIEDLLQ